MKEKDGIIDCPQQQLILFVEKEDGKYEPVQTGSYLTKNFLDDYELKRHHLEESLKKQILSGEVSPIYYFMVLEELTLSELAARAGIRKGKVRKHMQGSEFASITPDVLQKYADVFNITVPEMLKLLPSTTESPAPKNTP